MTLDPAPSIVITDCDHGEVGPETAILSDAGLTARLEACVTAADVIAAARDADALINQYAPIDEEVVAALTRCRVIVRYGVGVDNVDVDAATRHGIWVVNVPDYGVEEVADHALALFLALARGIGPLDRAVRAGEWEYRRAPSLHRVSAMTVGVVGCGRIGRITAEKLRCLGATVLATDVAGVPADLQERGVEAVSLEDLLRRADGVTLHVPLGNGTNHLIAAEQLALMKPTAFLINTARGGLVDTDALVAALEGGHLAGAALDVLEEEPPGAASPLSARDDGLVTPHSAWFSEESYQALKTEVAREVVRVLNGERPRSPVNEPEGVRRG